MILGIGTDVVEKTRINALLARFGERFRARVFTPAEREAARGRACEASALAKRFAAKEACLKALGTGLAGGISWQDMEIANDARGAPSLHLRGAAAARLSVLTPAGTRAHIHLSLSDERGMALAFVVIEARR